jgi:hypothetical protein
LIIIEIKEFGLMKNKILRISDENGGKRLDFEYRNKTYFVFEFIYVKRKKSYGENGDK